MSDTLEQLVDSLLWEGYALYPYTPTATKNATPTPFGIVYPPVYAETLASTYDHLELRCVLEAPPDAILSAEVRFLAADGERHQAQERRVKLSGAMVGALAQAAAVKQASVSPGSGAPPLAVALSLTVESLPDGLREVVFGVDNRTLVSSGLDRAGALGRSLISTHPIVRITGGRFVSPLERPCRSVNTFPVLATHTDDVVIGAAIVLPDHPEIAPESRGGLFDSTEIEEALLLHVHALSDAERAEIERQDPAGREMVARAAAATPEEIIALHGRVTVRDPETNEPPTEPPGLTDPRAGEESADVDGVTFRRGAAVVIRPGPDADLHARMLDGRTATIERIFTDYDGRTHLGVTIDDDPGQELMRETGRYLFFFAEEVEVMDR
ncbi:MAG: hypothetical protein ACXVUE_11740 [Solirubrobacteraceae bacterium]